MEEVFLKELKRYYVVQGDSNSERDMSCLKKS